MKIKKTTYCAILVILGACQSAGENGQGNLSREELVGEWRNLAVKMEMPSYQGGSSTFRLDANEDNWEQVMEMKPIRTYFYDNGTYRSEYRNLRDSIFMAHTGSWEVRQDSLVLHQREPVSADYRYAVSLQGDTATFVTVTDFDGDGQQDDNYVGIQKKYN